MCVGDPQVVDPFSSDWNDSIAAHPDATIFHTSEWARVLADSYGYQPSYLRWQTFEGAKLLCLFEINSWITGRRAVSVPFSDEAPGLGFHNANEFNQILRRLGRLGIEKGWDKLEIRGAPADWLENTTNTYFSHELDLSSPVEELFSKCSDSVRRAVRKAERLAVKVEIRSDSRAVEEYFELHCITRKKHGLPPQPLRFFQNIHKHIIAAGFGFTALARLNSRNLAGAIFFIFRGKALYKFGASDPRMDIYRPSNLVMWRGIQRMISMRAKTFSFGRTDLDQDGLRRYKLGWGASEKVISYLSFDPRRDAFLDAKTYTGSNQVFRLLPIAILKRIGAVLYPHVG
jgi:hypothetical protein